jgi:hypothetical protein
LHGHRDVGVRCNEDDWHLPPRRGKIALKLETACARHSDVEQQANWPIRQLGFGKIGNRRKLLNVQADRAQEAPDRIAKVRIVVDDYDAGVRFTHPWNMHKGRAFFLLGWRLYYSQSFATNSPFCLSEWPIA